MNCPIRGVSIPGLEAPLDLSGLIVIVGPNSSGKTQLLQDLNDVVLGNKRDLVVLSAVHFNVPPDYEELFQLLLANRAIVQQDNNNYRKLSFQFGSEQGGGDFHKGSALSYHREYGILAAGKSVAKTVPFNQFLQVFGPFSTSALFLRNRLTLMDTGDNFDPELRAPATTLQALHLNSRAKELLTGEIAATFGRGIWIDAMGRYGHLIARLSNTSRIPPDCDRLEPDRMLKYRGIESEGDGIRSYAAICSTLLLERRPLCLIDEPEMCLHPPQAYAMGRFIGKHVSDGTATVVSTHSSHVLRGILEANPRANVIRLSRSGSDFNARLLKPEALQEATSKPRSRAEAILEGLFAQAVLICESDGDRIVYESTYRTLSGRKIDIRFVTAEGTGGFADPLRLYSALGVPSVVVADVDFLDKETELKNVLTALGTNSESARDLCSSSKIVMQLVKAAKQSLDAIVIAGELKSLAESLGDTSQRAQTSVLRGKLKRLTEQLNPLSDLKKAGVDSIADSAAKQQLGDILQRLGAHGLFLVPVGELESWLPILMRGITPGDKGKWAMLAAEKIEATGERDDDVWRFIRSVAEYLFKRCKVEPTESA